MNDEEYEKLSEIIAKVQAMEDRIRDMNITNNRLLHIERGRLIKLYQSNLSVINALYDKYDMYINIHNILYTKTTDEYNNSQKINDIKNFMVKPKYSKFEEEILKIIQDNVDNLSNMKKGIYDLDKQHGLKSLITLRNRYLKTLSIHKESIKRGYYYPMLNKENIRAKIPNNICLTIDRFRAIVKQIKGSKENKEKVTDLIDHLKLMGCETGTSIIYYGDFFIDNTYLLMLSTYLLPQIIPRLKKEELTDST